MCKKCIDKSACIVYNKDRKERGERKNDKQTLHRRPQRKRRVNQENRKRNGNNNNKSRSRTPQRRRTSHDNNNGNHRDSKRKNPQTHNKTDSKTATNKKILHNNNKGNRQSNQDSKRTRKTRIQHDLKGDKKSPSFFFEKVLTMETVYVIIRTVEEADQYID